MTGSLTNLTLDLQTLPTSKADVAKMANGKRGTSRGKRKIEETGTKLNVSPRPNICLLFIVFLHLFILQAIYIVLQDLKMKMLFVELNIRLQE